MPCQDALRVQSPTTPRTGDGWNWAQKDRRNHFLLDGALVGIGARIWPAACFLALLQIGIAGATTRGAVPESHPFCFGHHLDVHYGGSKITRTGACKRNAKCVWRTKVTAAAYSIRHAIVRWTPNPATTVNFSRRQRRDSSVRESEDREYKVVGHPRSTS
jgi:hypothetical protein